MAPIYQAIVSVKINTPKVGSYDWDHYGRVAVNAGDLTWDELDNTPEDSAWAVAEAMVRDYLERGDSCTASTYVIGNSYTMDAPKEV